MPLTHYSRSFPLAYRRSSSSSLSSSSPSLRLSRGWTEPPTVTRRLVKGVCPFPIISRVASQRNGFAMFAVCGDATNAAIMGGCKVHNLFVESVYKCWDDDVSDDDYAWRRDFADLQIVADGTGPGTVDMIQKQMRSTGAPDWSMVMKEIDTDPKSTRTFYYFLTSDQGSDEAKAKKIIQYQ
eukprot:4703728-Pyramimonas_sp.AAC.2